MSIAAPPGGADEHQWTELGALRARLRVCGDKTVEILAWFSRPGVEREGPRHSSRFERVSYLAAAGTDRLVVDAETDVVESRFVETLGDQA